MGLVPSGLPLPAAAPPTFAIPAAVGRRPAASAALPTAAPGQAAGVERPTTPSGAAGAVAAGTVGLAACCRRQRRRRAQRSVALRAGFGPNPYETNQRESTITGDVGERVASVVNEETRGIQDQLRQYGYSQVDGFLGGSINGYPDTIRDEMKKLFDRGWFQQETEEQAAFKVGQLKMNNQDRDHRFMSKLMGNTSNDESAERAVETQYEVAPTVINFTRSLIGALSAPIGKLFGGKLSTNVAIGEMTVLCGNGSRYDRRVSNEFGWNTEQGFAPDTRKLVAMYFVNPNYREELGGHLQLEGVITPTGAVSIAPIHDRLVLFWADKTVWSVRPSQASMISEHQYAVLIQMMATDFSKVDYRPTDLARWFPELRNEPMPWPPPYLSNPAQV